MPVQLSFLGMSVIVHSVVRIIPATEAALRSAFLIALVVSIIPADIISQYSSVAAL